MTDYGYIAKKHTPYGRANFRFSALVWYALGILDFLLLLRLLFRIQLNDGTALARFVYQITDPLIQPVLDVFHASAGQTGETIAILTWSTFIAFIVYALVALGIERLLTLIGPLERRGSHRHT